MGRKKTQATPPAPSMPAVVSTKPGEGALVAIGSVARRLGYAGFTFDEMTKTWLRQIVATKDSGSRLGGRALAGAVVNFMGLMLTGVRSSVALAQSGLDWNVLVMLMEISDDFEKVLLDVYRIRKAMVALKKESMGEDVLSTAFELATVGEEQHNYKTGESLGFRKKSEKMLDRLLVMSGGEFRKDGGEPGGQASGGGCGGITLNFHFDGKGRPSSAEVVDV